METEVVVGTFGTEDGGDVDEVKRRARHSQEVAEVQVDVLGKEDEQ